MKMKKLLKNKWFWIVLIVAFLFWNYRRNQAANNAANNNSSNRTTDPILQNWQGIKSKVKYFVTLLAYKQSNFETLCQRAKQAGADGLIFPVEMGRILQPTGSYNWAEYDFAFQTMAKYNLLIDAKIMTQITAGQAFLLKPIFSDNDFMKGNDGRTDWNNFKSLSFSSPKWESVVYPFVKAFCDRYQTYNQKGYIAYFKPSHTYTQEFSYPGEALCDYSPFEQSRYGSEIPGDAGNLNFYKFRTENLKRVFGKLAAIAKGKGYKVMVDNGSTIDSLSKITCTYAAEYWAGSAQAFKENPDFSYDRDFQLSKILSTAVRKNAHACVEITWTGINDLNERKNQFLQWCRQAADWGFDYIALSFLDPSDLTRFNVLKGLLSDLRSSGHLNRIVSRVPFVGSVNYTVQEFIETGGHQNSGIYSRFVSARQAGKPTNIQVINNL